VPAAPDPPWSPGSSGVTVSVRLTPKGGRDAIDGIDVLADGRAVLKARVAAPPSEGAANEALCRLIAKAVGIAPRDVALVAGGVGRIKRLAISGDPATLIASLEKIAVKR
jgi:uncharacterized protein (TIGR00251 family)